MAKLEKEKHICKFRRLRYKSGNEIFFCALPDCSKKLNPALLLGKRSICWRCGNDFIMNEYSLRLAKPHCEKCHKPKGIDVTMDEIVGGLVGNGKHDILMNELSLAERLSQTLKQANEGEEEI